MDTCQSGDIHECGDSLLCPVHGPQMRRDVLRLILDADTPEKRREAAVYVTAVFDYREADVVEELKR